MPMMLAQIAIRKKLRSLVVALVPHNECGALTRRDRRHSRSALRPTRLGDDTPAAPATGSLKPCC